jgi:putative membrane protein
VSYIDIHYASESPTYAAARGISDGVEVTLTGFVTHPHGLPSGEFQLTRFSIFCCAADAVPYSATIDDRGVARPATWPDNTWLTVSGRLAQRGSRYVVIPSAMRRVGQPKDPYLHP